MKISIIKGDITDVKTDALVNPAHPTLMGGSGVDGAIHKAAGKELLKECIRLRKEKYPEGLQTGEVAVTKAYNLSSKIIIHTVGPRFYSQDAKLLKNCYINSLKIAEEHKCKNIAFPAISTGAYGMPIEKSVEIIKEILTNYKFEIIEEIILVLFDQFDFDVYTRELGKI